MCRVGTNDGILWWRSFQIMHKRRLIVRSDYGFAYKCTPEWWAECVESVRGTPTTAEQRLIRHSSQARPG